MDNKEKNSDFKKTIEMIGLIIIVMICVTGATYAYFAINATNNSITGDMATTDLTIDVTREAPNVESWNSSSKTMVPQLSDFIDNARDEENDCVDANGNVVCQVLKIEVTNTSTVNVVLNGMVHFSYGEEGNFENLYWKILKDKCDEKGTLGSEVNFKAATSSDVTSDEDDTLNANLVKDVSLAVEDTATYYIVVWVKEINDSQNETDYGTWTANVTFTSANGTGITSTIDSGV